jgi:glycerol-3-phosphate cytidylyltransferase
MRVYTGGTFDLFHAGHVQFLKKCWLHGAVTVALNTDEFVKDYKGISPIMTFAERYELLKGCRYVDDVVANLSGSDSKPTIESVGPDIIIIGDDWKDKDYLKQMQFTSDWLEERGIRLIYVPYTKNISTTDIKKRICQQ